MNKYIQEYQKIVSTVVKKSFPSLKNKKIRIIEYGILTGPYYFFTSGFEAYLFGTHLVGFNIKLRKLKDSKEEVLNALIAHELCHAEDHEKFKNDIEIIIHCIKYAISQISGKSYCRITERKTDIQTIKKGYGKELMTSSPH